MKESYEKAQEKSYANQEGGITIPADKLNGIVRIPLGFQPLGISSSGGKIAIAAYFEPAICMAKVSQNEKGLHFEINWIRAVNHGVMSVRLFPDFLQYGEANRAQTVNFGPSPNGTLWVSRNADREIFVLACPDPQGRWVLTDKISFPLDSRMVHSILLLVEKIITIESTMDIETWSLNEYIVENGKINQQLSTQPVAPYTYGIAQKPGDDSFYLITDFRCKTQQHGIYQDDKLIIPDVYGNGICFLPDESALVTVYGQAHSGPFSGQPGQLVYVPKNLF